MNHLRPLEIEMMRDEVRRSADRRAKAGISASEMRGPEYDLLQVKSANDWMKEQHSIPMPRRLFGDFWFEDELCILFADTNLGKSVLAVQIGDSLTRFGNVGNFRNEVQDGVPVLYIDFELSAKQFELRYTDKRWGGFLFANHFYRAGFNPKGDHPILYEDYEDYVKVSVEAAIRYTKAKVLIIDNITYMRRGTENAKDALPLMKTLKAIKAKHNLSMLVLAHTPKRDPYKPLTINDLQGSKMLINFADSAFAIGQSQTEYGTRYLKQIKQRSTVEVYGETNVCLCRQSKNLNFLQFDFQGFAHERDHLLRPADRNKQLLKEQIHTLSSQGQSTRQVAAQLNISNAYVSRVLNGKDSIVFKEGV